MRERRPYAYAGVVARLLVYVGRRKGDRRAESHRNACRCAAPLSRGAACTIAAANDSDPGETRVRRALHVGKRRDTVGRNGENTHTQT